MKKLTIFFKSLLVRTKETFYLYPVSMAVIVLAFSLMMINTWTDSYWEQDQFITRLTTIAWVILPVFTGLTLFLKQRWLLLVGLVLGLVLFFTTEDAMPQEDMQQLVMWGGAFYSLMFILPHWKKNQNNGFWSYCAQILFVMILGFVCSGILALSLTVAIESIRNLFFVEIDWRWDETMALFSFFFVLPIFVHVGLPQNWKELENTTDHPHFFKPISYYLLTPISLLFFGILTVYMAKILITWQWPSGQVAYPVIYLSLVTFGFYLISYPWRLSWQRWFFVALLPFLVMYFAALGMRIDQYGLTEMRYLGILLGACLALMSVYFAFVKRQRLQMMLLPLAVVAFLFAMGPWGASELPIRSQEKRLETILIEIGALQNGKLVEVEAGSVDKDTETEISSIVEYLRWRDRLDDLQAWTDVDLVDEDYDYTYDYRDVGAEFMAEMGLEFRPWVWTEADDLWFDYSVKYSGFYDVEGFDGIAEFDANYDSYYKSIEPRTFTWEERGLTLTVDASSTGVLTVSDGTNELSFDLFALEKQLKEAGQTYELDPSALAMEGDLGDLKMRVQLYNFSGLFTDANEEAFENYSVYGKILVDFE